MGVDSLLLTLELHAQDLQKMKPSLLNNRKLSISKTNYKEIPTIIYRSLLRNKNLNISLSEEDIEFLETRTTINKAQIDAQYKIFLTKHPTDKYPKKSFRSMMAECYPNVDTHKLSKHIWRMYDTNLDGCIDFREFMMVLYVMSNGSPEENLQQIFRVFDIDNNGKIELVEMKRIVKDLLTIEKDNVNKETVATSAFSEMDENEDGEVSQEEFPNPLLSSRKFSTMLALKVIDIFVEN